MADLQAALRFAWGGADVGTTSSDVQSAMRFGWVDRTTVPGTVGGFLQSVGSPYIRPPDVPEVPPPAGGSLEAAITIPDQTTYEFDVSLSAQDLRTGLAFSIETANIELAEGSVLWTLSATSDDEAVYTTLTTGELPAQVSVTLGGDEWHFAVDQASLAVEHASARVAFSGRSLAALADAPRQSPRQWIAESPTTVAQIATVAQAYTGLGITWLAPDWPVPAQAWSYFGTPLGVVRQTVAALGGVAEATRAGNGLTVRTKYPAQPITWAGIAPDWQVPWRFVVSSSIQALEQTEYNGVFVAGQQQGLLADVRLAGTAGDLQAPMVTDPLLTDLTGIVERATSILFSSGNKTRVTRTLLVPPQGVLGREQLVRWVDPTETWVGLVRSVSVSAAFGFAQQTVAIERRTTFPAGTFIPEPPPTPPGESPPRVITVATQSAAGVPLVLPTHAAGDLLILFLRAASGDTPPATPSGWTSLCTSSSGSHRGWRVVQKVDTDNTVASINEAN